MSSSPVTSRVARALSCFALMCSLLAAGCSSEPEGPPRGAISGKVTFNGEPVDGGTISFYPESPGPMATTQIVKGEYSLPGDTGPVVGINLVKIEWAKDTGEKDGGGAPIFKNVIPPKYNSQSAEKVTVEAGSNTHDFNLTAN